ncbi:hypothetical protein RB623_11090 [Mesorhizobium sp. LHD-90]|uniref:4-fold beta flower protein n=1 Tax=Mesorhizobium sp. LHD-90 TaxID=3071414 RepID=UPI0027E0C20F|nr:hypothetical protein [Mesorhizobium sp. LHD-90]MDQ6434592.1 hypothetical protein [Mesorhizobium sp. LHD-90]
MLTPLFSPGCDLVGWMQPQKFLFDTDMAYAAFIANGHAWSARSGRWIGPVIGPHVFDLDGRPVAWNPDAPLRGFGRPLRPVNVVRAVSPVRPAKPVAPMRPLTAPSLPGGWSQFSFAEWLVSCDPRPVEVVEEIVAVETADEVAVVEEIIIGAGTAEIQDNDKPSRNEVK